MLRNLLKELKYYLFRIEGMVKSIVCITDRMAIANETKYYKISLPKKFIKDRNLDTGETSTTTDVWVYKGISD